MTCLFPPPLTPDQIDAVLEGVADPDVAEHTLHCPDCAARVAEARQLEQRLAQRLHRWDCPPAQVLTDYHFGLLEAEQRAGVTQHAERCQACQADLNDLRAFLAREPRGPAVEATPRTTQRRMPALGELIARLLPRTPGLALRGEAAGPLVAEAGEVTLVLELHAQAEGSVELVGQVATPDPDVWAGALVQLWQAGELQASGVVDEVSGFRLAGGTTGLAELRFISARGATIVWPDLDLTT